jgi:hypothetical protein
MKLVARPGRRPAKIDPLAKTSDSPAASALEGLALAHNRFKAIGQQGANRAALFGGDHSRFPKQIGVELQGDVGLQGFLVQHKFTCWYCYSIEPSRAAH